MIYAPWDWPRPWNALSAILAGMLLFGAGAFGAEPPVPNDLLTPGAIASTNQAEICVIIDGGVSYSRAHRHTSRTLKDSVLREYGVPRPFYGEIDHRVPLSLGGADVISNLWPEPAPSFHEKDRLELWAWKSVCWGGMSLAHAQGFFLGDWRKAYRYAFGADPK